MTAKSSKKLDNTQSTYWKALLPENVSSSKLWIENYETDLSNAKKDNAFFQREKMQIGKKLFTKLKTLSAETSIPILTLFHGAWGLLLNHYAGVDQIVYGNAIIDKLNKQKIAIKSTVVPLQSLIAPNESIHCYLAKLHKQFVDNRHHATELGTNDRYQVGMNYFLLETEGKIGKSTGVLERSQCHLALLLNNQKLNALEIIFDSQNFTQDNIKSFLEHLLIVLQRFIEDLEQTTSHFSILSSQEKHILLDEWSKPHFQPANFNPHTCVHDLFYKAYKKYPDKLAVFYNNVEFTYHEIENHSNAIAMLLLEKGIQVNDKVAVLMERTPDIIVAMLAIFKVGATYVPINPKYPAERLQFILADCKPQIIFVNNIDQIQKQYLDITYSFPNEFSQKKINKKIFPKLDENTIAYIIYTSGTTGQPKGVMIQHKGLVNLALCYKKYFSISSKDRISQFASQGFDTFFCETIPSLCHGASVHIIDDNSKLTPSLLLPWLVKQKITICDLPTAYLQILFNLKWPDELSLRIMKVGGESLTRYPHQMLPFDIWNIYGPTEATVEATFNKIFEKNVLPDKQKCKHIPPPIGKPIANSEMYVVDQHLEPVPMGVVGELLIGGDGLSPGYLNRPQLNKDRYIRNFFSTDPNKKLYRTGDLVRWLRDGNLEFIGRVDNQVKIRGYRIELSEIETTLTQFADVQEVVVLAKELINGQKTLVAYLTPNLDKIRIPFQERCLITLNDNNFNEIRFIDSITEDISKHGVAVTGLAEVLSIQQSVQVNIKLPGMSESQWFTGKVVWFHEQRAGIQFEENPEQILRIKKSIEYYLSTHNLLETLKSASAKRSLRKALKKKLPEYMIPSVFTVLPEFPLTFNGKIDYKALPPPQEFERLLERKYVAPRNETEKILAEMWLELLGQQISITDNFFDLGGNSLLVSHLSVKIMQRFQISIPAKIFFDLPFIPVIAEYIDSNGTKISYTSSLVEEIQHDAVLNEHIQPLKEKNSFINNPRGILLTGASGFVGVFLLKDLIEKTKAKIYCLIRKGEFESCAKRLLANIEHYELSDQIALANRRIVIIASDMGLDRFGIPEEHYNSLVDKIDVIYHCGAHVNTMASYTHLRNSNVQGTLEVIKFATKGVNKSIHYISTLSAAYQVDKYGRLSENFPDASSGNLVSGYALSKWVSERLLTQLKNKGLPVCIYRSGYILGESSTGITNTNDALLLLIKGCIQLGFAPKWKEIIAILPVNFINMAIVEIANFQGDQSDVFHLDHPKGIMWMDLIAWFNDYGYSMKFCSHQEWLEMLPSLSAKNALFPFLPHYLAMKDEPQAQETAMDNTAKVLKKIGLSYPDIDDGLLKKYIKYLNKIGFLPPPIRVPI